MSKIVVFELHLGSIIMSILAFHVLPNWHHLVAKQHWAVFEAWSLGPGGKSLAD